MPESGLKYFNQGNTASLQTVGSTTNLTNVVKKSSGFTPSLTSASMAKEPPPESQIVSNANKNINQPIKIMKLV